MRTLATAVAMATVLTIPAAAKTLLKNPQRLLPEFDYQSKENQDLKNDPRSGHQIRARAGARDCVASGVPLELLQHSSGSNTH
jgi:hypothetical protein